MTMLLGYILMIFFSAAEKAAVPPPPLLDYERIDAVVKELKKQNDIPAPAIDKAFAFYKANRPYYGGLRDRSCLEQKGYKVRVQDGKFKKESLYNGVMNESCVCIADYTRPKTEKRGFCVFLNKDGLESVEKFPLAHGSGSVEKNGCPTTFTNKLTPTGTTLSGLHLTAKTTSVFGGKDRSKPYTSMGLSLYGVEESNWTATAVGKVTHGAPYVQDMPQISVGDSLGCPAMPMDTARKILPRCQGQAVWLNYTFEDRDKKITDVRSCNATKTADTASE